MSRLWSVCMGNMLVQWMNLSTLVLTHWSAWCTPDILHRSALTYTVMWSLYKKTKSDNQDCFEWPNTRHDLTWNCSLYYQVNVLWLLKYLTECNYSLSYITIFSVAGKSEAEGWLKRCLILRNDSVSRHYSMPLQHLSVALGRSCRCFWHRRHHYQVWCLLSYLDCYVGIVH